MTKRFILPATAAAVLILGVSACGDDTADQGSPQSEDTLAPVPAESDGFVHPAGADEVVISYAEVGGFVPMEFAFQQTPSVLVSGDGHSFSPGAQIAIYPGPMLPAVQVQSITEDGIQAILAAAEEAGLLQDVEYESPTNIADASTARVVINVNGETYVHEAYALGIGDDGGQGAVTSPERDALAGFIAELSDLSGLAGADQLGETELFEATEYGIQGIVVEDLAAFGGDGIEPTVVEWPTEVSVRLADATECTRVPAAEVAGVFAEANQLTFFDDAGVTYQVLARPILPGDTCGA